MYFFAILLRLVTVWLAYRFVKTIYSVYFGPLSKVPGPKLAAATRLCLIYYKYQGKQEVWRLNLHEKYGDVVRPAPTEVSFATGKAWKDVYGYIPGSKLHKNPKDPKFYADYGKSPSLIIADDPTHVRQRKIFSHAFSDRALKDQEPMIQKHISQLISNLEQSSTSKSKTDIVKDYNFTTFDIMGDLAWGEPLGCLQNSTYTPWINMVWSAVKLDAFLSEIRSIPILTNPLVIKLIILALPKSIKEKAKTHQKHAADRVDRRLAKEDARPDIWGKVLEAKEDQKLELGEMHANAHLFMIAGTETTATLLSGVTYHLLRHPDMMKTLTSEIRNSFPFPSAINITSVSKLPYLDACINEGLRIYPPVPTGMPRVVAKGGARICGYDLPEKTTIYVHHYATYRNPRNFSKPNHFRPERWLEPAMSNPQSEFYRDDRSAVQPFSVGPRNCLGISLAHIEMRLILASVLYHYDLRLCEESEGWDEQRVFNLWEKGKLMVEVEGARTWS